MTITQALKTSKIDPREAELLLAYVLKQDRAYLRTHNNDVLSLPVLRRFKTLVGRRLKHEPVAYLVGYQPFCGHDFLVNRSTLIPRPETEGLAELVIAELKRRRVKCPLIVDVGTGSGCLAVTFALARRDATVIASDVSDKALAVAKKNARRLKADVTFVQDSLLGDKLVRRIITESPNDRITKGITKLLNDKITKTPDLVFVSNLPYLPSSDKKNMMPDVTGYEPSTALFAGKEGMSLIEKLFRQISRLDVGCVSIFLEIDPRQSAELKELTRELFPMQQISIKQDLCGRDRYLIINRE